MNELHQKALFIRKWLLMNARYHDMSYTSNEAYDTARHYAEKLDIHGIETTSNTENPRRPYFSFRIRVGKPKFRGATSYTLLPHSLHLSTNCNSVRIVVDYNAPSWYKSLVQSLYGNRRRRSIERAFTYPEIGSFSGHPHIAHDGTPCLGGWSSAWSQTVSTGNLISLVPVTQSFLNTWTSNDAYWDINSCRRSWAIFPLWARKEIPLAMFLAKINLFYNFQRDLDSPRRIQMIAFPRWVTNNNELVQQLLMDGFSLEKLMDGFYASYLKFNVKEDTKDYDIRKLKQAMGYIQDIYYLALDNVVKYLPCGEQMAGALVTQALMGTKERYVLSPWDKGPTRTASLEPTRINEYISHSLNESAHIGGSGHYSRNCNLNDILDFFRHMNNKNTLAYSRNSYLDKDDILKSIRYYLNNRRDGHSFYEYAKIVNTVSNYIGINGTLATDASDDVDSLEINFLNHMHKIYDWKDDVSNEAYGDKINEIAEQFTYIALDQYENLLLKTIKRRTKNGKNKIRTNIQNNNTRDGEQQSQISIDTF